MDDRQAQRIAAAEALRTWVHAQRATWSDPLLLVAPPASCGSTPEPVFANVTAKAEKDPDTIRNQLVDQVTGMVRWRESVANMFDAGVHEFVEIGGKVLGSMVKRIAPDATVTSIVTIEDVEAAAKEIA